MFAPWKKRVQCWIREKEPSSLCFVHSRCTNLALNPNLQFLLSSTAGTDQSQYLDCMRCLSPCFRDAPGWDLKIAEVFWKESLVERRWMLCRWHCFAFPDTCRHLHIIFIAMLSFQPSLHFCFFQPYHMLYQKVTPKKINSNNPPLPCFCAFCVSFMPILSGLTYLVTATSWWVGKTCWTKSPAPRGASAPPGAVPRMQRVAPLWRDGHEVRSQDRGVSLGGFKGEVWDEVGKVSVKYI